MADRYELIIERRGSLDGWDSMLMTEEGIQLQCSAGRLADVAAKLVMGLAGVHQVRIDIDYEGM